MALDLTGIGEAATSAKAILGMFFPDKTEQERDKLAASLSLLNAQTDIDKAEAQSTDPLQHWRGGLGWVCVGGYGYSFLLQPILVAFHVAAPQMDLGQLSTLTLGMLGLGALHVTERVKGAA